MSNLNLKTMASNAILDVFDYVRVTSDLFGYYCSLIVITLERFKATHYGFSVHP